MCLIQDSVCHTSMTTRFNLQNPCGKLATEAHSCHLSTGDTDSEITEVQWTIKLVEPARSRPVKQPVSKANINR